MKTTVMLVEKFILGWTSLDFECMIGFGCIYRYWLLYVFGSRAQRFGPDKMWNAFGSILQDGHKGFWASDIIICPILYIIMVFVISYLYSWCIIIFVSMNLG